MTPAGVSALHAVTAAVAGAVVGAVWGVLAHPPVRSLGHPAVQALRAGRLFYSLSRRAEVHQNLGDIDR